MNTEIKTQKNIFLRTFLVCAIALTSLQSLADGDHTKGIRADSHAPIGVMGDHLHNAGEFMVSFRWMTMSMDGNIQGSDSISDEDIVTTIPNRFAMMPGMPPTLRIVPQDMTTNMQMLGLMYAPSDKLTLMAMLNRVEKEMTLTTFSGGMGTNVLGSFTTRSSGLGDTKLSALVRGFSGDTHNWHLNIGFSLPTGEYRNRDTILTPMNMTPEVRLPYSMQLGSGTVDFEPGFTYFGKSTRLTWGSQYRATLRTGTNDEGYAFGDVHNITAWGQYLWSTGFSSSLRINVKTFEDIEGMDSQIMGPVQTADPDNYGGDFVDLIIGANLVGQNGALRGHRLGVEFSLPVLQDVNGVQMEMENMLTIGYQYAF